MAGCNNDKLKAFLTKPQNRKARRLEEAQEAEHQAGNRFNGKNFFDARVLTVPTDLSEALLVLGSDERYNFYCYVKIFDIHDGYPEPWEMNSASEAVTVMMQLERAVTMNQSYKVGDLVTVFKNTPADQDTSEFFSIAQTIASDEDYAEKMSLILSNNTSDLQAIFNNQPTSDQIQAEIDRLRSETIALERTLWNGESIVNGILDDENFDYVTNADGSKVTSPSLVFDKEDGSILFQYTSTDAEGGMAFIKPDDGTNYAENFIELCRAYKAEAMASGWDIDFIVINSCFRSYDKQLYLEATQPQLSATPGQSDHGWGMAFDWGSGLVSTRDPEFIPSPQHQWMKDNAPTFGFTSTLSTTNEAWHFEILNQSNIYTN